MFRSIPIAPSVALAAVFLLGAVGTSIYAFHGTAPSPAFLSLYFVGVAWALSWWVLEDCRRLGLPVSIDHGWFVLQWWPLVVPYHLLKTRRTAGCAFLAAIVVLFVIAWGIGVLVFLIASAITQQR